MISIIFLIYISLKTYAQIVLTPVEVKSFSVGDVVEFELVKGEELLDSSHRAASLFNHIDPSKLILMKGISRNNKKIFKIVIGSSFNDKEKLQVGFNGDQVTLSFQDTFLLNNSKKVEEGFIYQEADLLKVNKKYYLLAAKLFLIFLFLFLVIYGARKGYLLFRLKKNKKIAKQNWINRLQSSHNLTSCSTLWLDRDQMRRDLPEYLNDLNYFLETLSPDQFSPSMDENLSEEILNAREVLLGKIKEDLRGV